MSESIFLLKHYGKIDITLKAVLDKRGMTRNRLANLTGLAYNCVDRYYKNAPLSSVDLDVLSKMCYVLECEIGEILSYRRSDD